MQEALMRRRTAPTIIVVREVLYCVAHSSGLPSDIFAWTRKRGRAVGHAA